MGSSIESLQGVILNLDSLYDFTLRKTKELRPWACDEDGVFVGLQARYDFAKLYLSKQGTLSADDISSTQYFQLLNKTIDERPREGGHRWVYYDPVEQIQRFMALIESIKNNGYIMEEYSDILNRFCADAPPHREKMDNNEISVVNYKDRPYEGIMIVIKYKDFYSIWNGNHRLAALKVFYDLAEKKERNIHFILDGG